MYLNKYILSSGHGALWGVSYLYARGGGHNTLLPPLVYSVELSGVHTPRNKARDGY